MSPISGSTHNAIATLPLKPPALQAMEKSPASASGIASIQGGISSLQPREASLAGYLMARAALHRKIDGPVLENLRAGQESVQEVSELFPLGRSNVREDIAKAEGKHTTLRNLAAFPLLEALAVKHGYPSEKDVPESVWFPMLAATSQYTETGTCGSYASNTVPRHAAKLDGRNDRQAIVASSQQPGLDHIWAEMMPLGKDPKGSPIHHDDDVIMDGWCKESLAILREDSEYARLKRGGKGNHLEHKLVLDYQSGPKGWATVEDFKSQIEGSRGLQQVYHEHFEQLVADGPKVFGLWNAETVFHEDFRNQAAAALYAKALRPELEWEAPFPGVHLPGAGADSVSRQAKHASLEQIRAIGVARSLGLDVRPATAEAPRIIDSAREMFPPQKEGIITMLTRLFSFFPSEST